MGSRLFTMSSGAHNLPWHVLEERKLCCRTPVSADGGLTLPRANLGIGGKGAYRIGSPPQSHAFIYRRGSGTVEPHLY